MSFFACPPPLRSLLFQKHTSVFQQCRAIHLMQAATAKIAKKDPRTHEYKDYVPLDYYKEPVAIPLRLSIDYPPRIKLCTLKQVLRGHIKPGVLLVPLDDPTLLSGPPTYKLQEIDRRKAPEHIDLANGRGKRGVKEFHFHAASPMSHFTDSMHKAWHSLKEGQRVEIHVHRRGASSTKPKSYFNDMIDRRLHLRPDILLKAMPPLSGIVIDPQTNFAEVCWVVGSARIGKTSKELEAPMNRTEWFNKLREEQLERDKVVQEKPPKGRMNKGFRRVALETQQLPKEGEWNREQRMRWKAAKRAAEIDRSSGTGSDKPRTEIAQNDRLLEKEEHVERDVPNTRGTAA